MPLLQQGHLYFHLLILYDNHIQAKLALLSPYIVFPCDNLVKAMFGEACAVDV
jgi:hypothetical protein